MINNTVSELIQQVSQWEGISVEPHRFGGREFKMGNVEIGHVHSNGMVDIPFTKRIREQLVTEGSAELHHLLKDSGWISFYLRRDADVEQAVWLMRLSYLHKTRNRNRKSDELQDKYAQELETLNLSDELHAILS